MNDIHKKKIHKKSGITHACPNFTGNQVKPALKVGVGEKLFPTYNSGYDQLLLFYTTLNHYVKGAPDHADGKCIFSHYLHRWSQLESMRCQR